MSNDKSLPLRIRQAIRDNIDAKDTKLNDKFASVTKTLGQSLSFRTEWSMLWTTLQSHYPDNATFVPSIVAIVCAFCDAFVEWLDRSESGKQVDQLLDDIGPKNTLMIKLELLTSPSITRPTAAWRSDQAEFAIFLPNSRPEARVAELIAGFNTDLDALFTSTSSTSQPAPDPSSSAVQDSEDWDALSDATPLTPASSALPTRSILQAPRLDVLPDVSTIDRPEELTKRPPYLLLIQQEGPSKVVVQGSHHESLVIIEKYLKTWGRTRSDHVNRPPVVTTYLRESSFGMGLFYDTLILEAGIHMEVSSMLVRVFVESVLGYEPVHSGTGSWSCWEYRRVRGFR